jgi:hypothetical protein
MMLLVEIYEQGKIIWFSSDYDQYGDNEILFIY